MSIRSSLWVLFLLVGAATLSAQAPPPAAKPGPEHKRLDVFVGKWNTEGQAQASPYGPAGKMTSVETFEWMPGGFFMIHHWDTRQGGVELKGLEVLGYDSHSKMYSTRFFDNLGSSGFMKATLLGNAWTWTGDSEVGGKPLKERCTTTLVSSDAWTSKCEFSSDGAKWLPNFDLKSARAK
jgi:hypothetical protein